MDGMTLDEVFIYLSLEGSRAEKCKKYAELLQSGKKGIPRVDSLQGDEYSSNGLCEWHKEKAFINRYFHGVAFEFISHYFEDPPPFGSLVVTGLPSPEKDGSNSRVYVSLPDKTYLVISTEGGGDRIRLISARLLTRAEVRKGVSSSTQSSMLYSSLSNLIDDDGVFCVSSEDNAVARRFFEVGGLFIDGKITEDFLRVILCSNFGLNETHEDFWVTSWLRERRNIDYLARQM